MSISTSQTPSGRTPEQDAVICALIGLARAAEAKEIPAGTAPVLFASLAPYLIHISEPTRRTPLSNAVLCLKKKVKKKK